MTLLLLAGILPLAWSGLVLVLTRDGSGRDRRQKAVLGVMLAPVILGGVSAALSRFAPLPVVAPLSALPPLPVEDGARAVAAAGAGGWGTVVMLVWMVWATVALWRTARVAAATARLARIVRQAAGAGETRLTQAEVPPFAWWGGRIVLPVRLGVEMDARAVALVTAHERAHLRRGDVAWFLWLALIDAALWFNPFVRAQTRRCRLAAEIACDAAAAGEDRAAYARALIAAARLGAHERGPVPAFPGAYAQMRQRLTAVLDGPVRARRRGLALAALLLPLLGGMQMAAAQGALPAAAAAPERAMLRAPVAAAVSSGFGMRDNAYTHTRLFHTGVDYAVAPGTPVAAAADGVVARVYRVPYRYGVVVEIDHAGGLQTRYAHLRKAEVAAKERVRAGQVVALSGASGRSAGPLLHFEVWKDGKAVDPAAYLPR